MSVKEMFNCVLLLWGSMFCAVAALDFLAAKNYEKEKRKWMIWMQLSSAGMLLSDALAIMFDGQPGLLGWWMVRGTNFVLFALTDTTMLLFTRYLCVCLLSPEETAHLRRVWVARIVGWLGVGLVVLNQFTGLYYTFDAANVYHRNGFYWISLGIPVVCMAANASLLLQYQHRVSPRQAMAISSYIVLPLVGASIQAVHYGWSLISLTVGVSMILMFLVATMEQNEQLRKLETSRAQIAEKLEIATVLNRCVEKLSSGGQDLDKATNELLGVINDYFQADRSYICELNAAGQVVNTHEFVQHAAAEAMEPLKVPFHNAQGSNGFLGVDNPRAHAEDPTLLASIRFFITNSLEQKRVQEKLRHLSYTDALTGLANRNRYIEVTDHRTGQPLEQVGGIYMDLNGLKHCNDSFGHEAGDALICRAADALNEVFPGQAYRIGGDEFVVLLTEIPQAEFAARVEQLRAALVHHEVSAAVGSVWRESVADLPAFLREADDRMYQEKEPRR